MNKRKIKLVEFTQEQLAERGVLPYILPTKQKHESGWAMFEVGYCRVKDYRVVEKQILGQCSDHVWNTGMDRSLNMDLTRDGYIRLFDHEDKLRWGLVGSSAYLK